MQFRLIKKGILFLAVTVFFLNSTAQVTRKPYLQTPTSTSMIIRWQTGTGEISSLKYGMSCSSLDRSITGSDEKHIYHELGITDLKPNTKYFYSVTRSLEGSKDYFFKTAPEAGVSVPLRIWVISDFGQSSSHQNKRRLDTVERWKSFNNGSYHANLVLSLGDQTEDDAIYQLQHNYFEQLENILINTPLFTVIGNHEMHDSAFNYFKTFSLPVNAEAGGVPSGTEKYYSFDYSNVHVVVLCTEIDEVDEFDKQTEWLKKDIENNNQDWLIAAMHRPFHSGGYHKTDISASAQRRREAWLTVLEANGVDLILNGHNHVYERSYLVDNLIGKTSSLTESNIINKGLGRPEEDGPYMKPKGRQPNKGTVFVGCTGAGVANEDHYYPEPISIMPVVYAGSDYEGSVVVDVDDNVMKVSFICNEPDKTGNHVWDSFTIIKE